MAASRGGLIFLSAVGRSGTSRRGEPDAAELAEIRRLKGLRFSFDAIAASVGRSGPDVRKAWEEGEADGWAALARLHRKGARRG